MANVMNYSNISIPQESLIAINWTCAGGNVSVESVDFSFHSLTGQQYQQSGVSSSPFLRDFLKWVARLSGGLVQTATISDMFDMLLLFPVSTAEAEVDLPFGV